MARPLEESGPVALLEDAAHLLRGASLETLLCHAIGGAPLALFLLVFWNVVTHPPVSDAVCAALALAAALLLVWMNCWRSVFAGRLHRDLTGGAPVRWSAANIWRLVVAQAVLSAAKPVVLPLAFVAVFPFIGAISFFRNASVLAGRGGVDPVAVFSKARALAGADQFQGWLLQCLLLLLSLALMLNVAIAFIVLPQLVRILTGYESAFTRGGESFFLSRLFVLCVFAMTWLLFDPFVQAVYTLRCFARESVETGEDLRAALRRVTAAMVVAVLLVSAAPARAASSIAPRDLEQAVRRTMQAPEYNWRVPPPPAAETSKPWIISATDRAIAAVRSAVKWVVRAIERFLRWIFGGLDASPLPAAGAAPVAALHWSVRALIAVALALAAWVGWRAFAGRRRAPHAPAAPALAPVRLDDADLTADRLPETGWLEMADRSLRDGDFRLAVRAFYLANLAWLGYEQLVTIHPGKTDREFEQDLRRRAPHAADARALFSANVAAFERAWYGFHDVAEEDVRAVGRRSEEMKSRLRAGVAA